MSEARAAAGGEPIELSQRGQLVSFLWLSIRNGLLNLITLTLYRFWGKTEVRRRLWATTYLNGEAFEYNADRVQELISDHPDTSRRAQASRVRAKPGAAAFTPDQWKAIKAACDDGYDPLRRLRKIL